MKKYLIEIFAKASQKLVYLSEAELIFEEPKITAHGDLSCNAAMTLAKKLKKNPRQIAEEIISNLDYDKDIIQKIEIAGPGFINFFFTSLSIARIIKPVLEQKNNFGRSEKYKGKKANVEFVSANPTGPLTVGHGRNAVIGDTVANLLEAVGYSVDREYYFNNAGRQMRVLGDSVKMRYLEFLGEQIKFPADYYQGEYIKDIAKKIFDEYGSKLKKEDPEGKFKEKAEAEIFNDIKNTLSGLNIEFNTFYNENSLYETKKIKKLLDLFEDKKLSYKKEKAIWLKLSELGNEQDKVIVKSTGEPTYRLPDIAYHITKFERGYDLMVDLFGSDHSATYPDVLAGIKALGYDDSKVKVLIHQFVKVMKEGEVVKMSTRKANF
ncbi:MAG: arginine--tRNA ligase, partial [Ignavibacteriaceae bacterium]